MKPLKRRPSRLTTTDLFCGAGGSSTGMEDAGVSLVMAVNHWARAIETHATNFQEAGHDCRNISETHPSRYPSTDILWASTECTTWSQARGKRQNFRGQRSLAGFEWDGELATEAEERSRATMWDVVRYSEYHDYHAVVVENVIDIWAWSLMPVWLDAMHKLGYRHRVLWLNSQFFGVPQSRDRIYIVFWKAGNPTPDLEFRPVAWCPKCEQRIAAVQSWKREGGQALGGRYRAQYVYRCAECGTEAWPLVVPAAAAIDWSLPSERIGDRAKPLAAATIARIEAGIDRYWRQPLVFDTMRDPKYRKALEQTMPTQTGRQSLALLTHFRGSGPRPASTQPVDQPMGTVTGGGLHHGLLTPAGGTWRDEAAPTDQPMAARTARESDGLLQPPDPLYVKMFGNRGGHPSRHSHPVSSTALGAITAEDHHALLQPPLYIKGYGKSDKAGPMAAPVDRKPFGTVTAQDHHALLMPPGAAQPPLVMTNQHHNRCRPADEEPLPTQATGNAAGLVLSYYGRDDAIKPASEPLGTVTGDPRHGVVRPTQAFLASYYRTTENIPVDRPMGAVTGTDRHALVEGPEITVEDCRFRMLEGPEIQLGMAFRADYVVTGNKREKVRQLGLGVTPPVAKWIVGQIVRSLLGDARA